MSPKIKPSKLLKNIYQKATSLIDEQPVVKDIVKGNNPDYTQVYETSIKGKLPDIIAKDPYFVSTTPYSRQGGYGEEIVYGIRKATPWQVAMGQDMKQRIKDLGYNISDNVRLKFADKPIYKPYQYISKESRKPIEVVDMIDESRYSGYKPYGGTGVLNLYPTMYKDKIFRTQLHETLMHGTDNLIVALEENAITRPSIINAYNTISSKISEDPDMPAYNWNELRATLGELRSWLYQNLAKEKGEDFYKEAKITPELRKEFIETVDNMPLGELSDELSFMNAYGEKYAKLLKRNKTHKLSNLKSGDFVLDQLKMLLKYYPAVDIGTSAIYNPEPDNYVEERKYKNGGQIYKKNLNKFTATKKRF